MCRKWLYSTDFAIEGLGDDFRQVTALLIHNYYLFLKEEACIMKNYAHFFLDFLKEENCDLNSLRKKSELLIQKLFK